MAICVVPLQRRCRPRARLLQRNVHTRGAAARPTGAVPLRHVSARHLRRLPRLLGRLSLEADVRRYSAALGVVRRRLLYSRRARVQPLLRMPRRVAPRPRAGDRAWRERHAHPRRYARAHAHRRPLHHHEAGAARAQGFRQARHPSRLAASAGLLLWREVGARHRPAAGVAARLSAPALQVGGVRPRWPMVELRWQGRTGGWHAHISRLRVGCADVDPARPRLRRPVRAAGARAVHGGGARPLRAAQAAIRLLGRGAARLCRGRGLALIFRVLCGAMWCGWCRRLVGSQGRAERVRCCV
mmetsp:Transcript_16992/g.49922  ORF Transcript_16992/g.49922 Transcript_16992/m.49922 type:complete len:299 (+) Transcript_16992:314-1210(+)